MSNSQHKKIVVMGEILWDAFPDGETLGGAPFNFAYYCNRLRTNRVCFLSALGDDSKGKEALEQVSRSGIDTRFLCFNRLPTGRTTIKMRPDGSHDFVIHQDVAWDHIAIKEDQTPELSNADLFYFGTLSQRSDANRQVLFDTLLPNNRKAFRVLDLNLRQQFYTTELIDRSLKETNLFKLNDEEWLVVKDLFGFPREDPEARKRLFDLYGISHLCITMGAEGAALYLREGQQFLKKADSAIDFVDSVGCGDAFVSELSGSLLHGDDEETALQKAVGLAGRVAEKKGALL